jgi:hypothetical protein
LPSRRIEWLFLPHDKEQTLHEMQVREELTQAWVVAGGLVREHGTPHFRVRPFHVANQLTKQID